MSNFGIGLGAFLSGVTQGAQAYSNIQGMRKQNELRDIQLQEAKDNASDRQIARADQQARRDIAVQGMAKANEANPGADGEVIMNYWMNNTAPKLQQHWMSVGEPQKAQAYGEWIKDNNVQQGMRYSAGMIRSAMTGDADGFAKNLVAAYNQPGYFENGQSIKSAQVKRDDKGNASGMEVILTDKDGKDTKHTFNSMDEVYQLAQQFGSPEKVFAAGLADLESAKKIRAETAKEKREFDRKITEKKLDHGFKISEQESASDLRRVENREQSDLRLNEQNNKVQLDSAYGVGNYGEGNKKVQEAQATIGFLRQNGVSEDYIKANLPAIVGLENKTRPMSSRVDDYIKMRSGADISFSRLSTQEQVKAAREYIAAVDAQDGGGEKAALSVANPSQSGTQSQQSKGLTPYYDSKTNKIIYR